MFQIDCVHFIEVPTFAVQSNSVFGLLIYAANHNVNATTILAQGM